MKNISLKVVQKVFEFADGMLVWWQMSMIKFNKHWLFLSFISFSEFMYSQKIIYNIVGRLVTKFLEIKNQFTNLNHS